MKQILQNISTGEIEITEIPIPRVEEGHLLIKTESSLISKGTEKMLLEFGKSGWISRAKQQPDKVKQVFDKVKTDGILDTIKTVKNKLDDPLPLGYCSVGEVIEIGKGVVGFEVGDRVASNGYHAEYISVPQNLCSKISDSINSDEASFTVLGSIALQGVRLLDPKIGDNVVVIGLGLVGLLTSQILKANGCEVIGVDTDKNKIQIAQKYKIDTVNLANGEQSIEKVNLLTNEIGADGVIITASSSDNTIIHEAAQMSRKRGKIILVGVVGLDLLRSDFYEKELTFQVSCSYGPGRYDDHYELKGNDYPVAFVRWTEKRNFEAILKLIENDKIDVKNLISHRYEFSDALEAYDTILNNSDSLGVVLNYENRTKNFEQRIIINNETSTIPKKKPSIGIIGAGSYTSSTLLPNLHNLNCELHSIVSTNGIKANHLGRKYDFSEVLTDSDLVVNNGDIDALIVTTQHDTHADFVVKAINANKSIFIEKPLAINPEQLDNIIAVYNRSKKPIIMVGFNRRFAPLVTKMKKLSDTISDYKSFIYTVNAGYIPPEHWVNDKERGGGRIIGEVCHFIDLIKYFANSAIVDVKSTISGANNSPQLDSDVVTINLKFNNGSHGIVHYLANGHKSFPKERFEVFGGNKVLQLDNFKALRGYGISGFKKKALFKQDKGHRNCLSEFLYSIEKGKESPISLEESIEVTSTTFQLLNL